jgi:hypothetical protein
MNEIIFMVEDAVEGGYIASALGVSIVTEADTLPELREMVRDAVQCHFDNGDAPRIIRLHFVREEVIAA